MRAPMDDTAIGWSSCSSPYHQQHHRRRSEMEPSSAHQTPLLGMRRTHPAVGLGVVGADTIAAARGSKRSRMATSSFSAGAGCFLEQERGKSGGGGGCSAFRWPDSGVCLTEVLKEDTAADGCGGGTGNAPELGGGCSAEHPCGMDVVDWGSGGGHESGSGPAVEEKEGKNDWRAVLGGANTGAGGSAVILSGFGAGGFPGHQWHQDQGGSSDDMLILYGSSS